MAAIALANENELLTRLCAGNQAAFNSIYQHYSDTIFHTAMLYLKDELLAEEIVQQIFIRLWEYRKNLKEVSNLRGYLVTATRNRIFDHLRQLSRKRKAISLIKAHLQSAGEDSTGQWLQEKQLGEWLDKAVSGLTPQQKLIYRLAEQEDMSYEEIASELCLCKSTVKKHMELARKYVRHYMTSHLRPELLIALPTMLVPGIVRLLQHACI